MKDEKTSILVDGFRFIENLQTTARQLIVCSEMAKQLNNKQLPKRILEELLVRWSLNEEEVNTRYKNSKGKITNAGKRTAALRHYYPLCESLGLISGFNYVFTATNTSYVLLHFLNNINHCEQESLSLPEKIFYLFQLFEVDADGILLCIDLLGDLKLKNQKQLQIEFKPAFNDRLITKGDLATLNHKSNILNKLRAVNYVWKSPEIYAEHIIAPRYEWLAALGLVNISREGSSTFYNLSDKGLIFYNYLPKIGQNQSSTDISAKWIYDQCFTLFGDIFFSSTMRKFSSLTLIDQKNYLGSSLEKAIKYVKSSLSYRLPLYNTYLFLAMDLFINQDIIINFSDIYESISGTFSYNAKTYNPKVSGRVNESYITVTLNK